MPGRQSVGLDALLHPRDNHRFARRDDAPMASGWPLAVQARLRALLRATMAFGLAAAPAAGGSDDAALASARDRMVEEIAAMARDTARSTGRARFSPRVEAAMRSVPRHRFVPAEQVPAAYDNRPLGIGHGQTISQPYIVALSTDLLDLEPGHRVLEIGTGSGYQAAVLAAIAREVYSIEIVEPLGREAATRLASLGYDVKVRIGDGYAGWPEHAPFDRILVTAAAPGVPQPLLDQLAPGGRMVIPVGSGPFGQDLMLVEKAADGTVKRTNVLPVRFVPFTGPGVRSR
jgi:protein-L-isoaspartate(D-aspartate) O-methyltransferase